MENLSHTKTEASPHKPHSSPCPPTLNPKSASGPVLFYPKGTNHHLISKLYPVNHHTDKVSVISTARQYNHPELTLVRDQWTFIYKKFRQMPSVEDNLFFFDFFDISKFYSKNRDYFLQTKDFLKKADLGLLDIKIEARERENSRGDKRTRFLPYGLHQSKGKKFQLPFSLESGGTLDRP